MWTLLFVLISPLTALQIYHAPRAALMADKSLDGKPPKLQLKFADGHTGRGGWDVIDKHHKYEETPDRTEQILRKIGKGKQHAWIVFVGDSNMRNTYYWWVMEQTHKDVNKLAKAKLHKSHHFNRDEAWSDQEAIFEYPDGFEVRSSFRFLHGQESQYEFKTTHWHSAQKARYTGDEDRQLKQIKAAENVTMDDPNAIQPSEQALLAAANRKLIDFKKESPLLAAELEKYETEAPGAVFMTEGWGGLPGCDRFEETLDRFKKNPETKFVWSPVYVTNRTPKRHQCFSEKIASVPPNADEQNFRFIDMWDWTQVLPAMSDKRSPHLRPQDWDGSTPVHVRLGGQFMQKAFSRLEDALDDLTN